MHVIITDNAAWNIWNYRRPIVEGLISDGHQVTLLAPTDDSTPELERFGARTVNFKMNVKGLNPFEGFKLYHRFKQVFKKEKPDIVLSYTIKNNIFGALAAKSIGIQFIPNISGLGTAFLSGWLLQYIAEQLYRNAFRKLSTIFFQNEDDRDLFIDHKLISADQARVVPGSGIDLLRFTSAELPSIDNPPSFLMIGRLLRDKGIFEYVEAAEIVKAYDSKVQFRVLGAVDSENRTAINMKTVQEWIEKGLIDYLGETSDVRPAIEEASCVVLPSYREGAPRTLIEAAAMARPVIATDVPGCRAVVDQDVSGYLCEVRNAESLADAIKNFLTLSPHDQQIMGQAGRTKMEREYDQTLVIKSYREAISGLVKNQ